MELATFTRWNDYDKTRKMDDDGTRIVDADLVRIVVGRNAKLF